MNCLVSLPTPRVGEHRSFMLTHRLEGSAVRVVKSRDLPPGTRFTVSERPRPVSDDSLEDTAPRKTLARGTGAGPESSLLTFRRRQLLTINSIESGTRWARFEGRDRNTWPRLARQVHTFLLGLAASGAFGKGADLRQFEVVCDERINTPDDVRNGVVNCLVSLPTPRVGEQRSFMLTRIGSRAAPCG